MIWFRALLLAILVGVGVVAFSQVAAKPAPPSAPTEVPTEAPTPRPTRVPLPTDTDPKKARQNETGRLMASMGGATMSQLMQSAAAGRGRRASVDSIKSEANVCLRS